MSNEVERSSDPSDADARRHQRVKRLFIEARACSADARDAFLCAHCDDEGVRREVAALLEQDERDGGRTDLPSFDPLESLEPAHSLVGRRIGPYRVLREIGSGGMGRVYEAEQESPRRCVALKVMRRGVASRAALRRFEFEVELLARLRHPGIAQVYAAGTFEDHDVQVPYFAMELVPDALPLDVYVERNGLAQRDRMELLALVCDAVHHGHQRGIVHRDLKPGNVLVDAEGRPKVIDFGVAKSTESDVALTTMLTHVGELIGTLRYMSPEQCDADPSAIDARSDVYSLGVVLYELVCGRPPYEIGDLPLSAAARVVRERLPERPSLHGRALRGDVEAILLEALEKEPARRYSSAAALAEDVRRHLAGLPILARPPSAWTRATQLAARHPIWTTAAVCTSVALASLVVTLIAIYVLNGRPARLYVDPSNRFADLESVAGGKLRTFETDANGGLRLAALVDAPQPMGGDRIAVVAYGEQARREGHAGELCYYRAADPARPIWTSASVPHVLPPSETPRSEAKFTVQGGLVADVFGSSQGPQVVALHRLTLYSATTVRIYDLKGALRYQVWNDGSLESAVWLASAHRLLVCGYDSEKRWDERGVPMTNTIARYPNVVIALNPIDGHIAADWCARDGRILDPSVAWYRWLGPVDHLAMLNEPQAALSLRVGDLDAGSHALYQLFPADSQRQPLGEMLFVFDAEGHVIKSFDDDVHKAAQASSRCPPSNLYTFFDYSELPRKHDEK
jgi:serine/threonine protein kinase